MPEAPGGKRWPSGAVRVGEGGRVPGEGSPGTLRLGPR